MLNMYLPLVRTAEKDLSRPAPASPGPPTDPRPLSEPPAPPGLGGRLDSAQPPRLNQGFLPPSGFPGKLFRLKILLNIKLENEVNPTTKLCSQLTTYINSLKSIYILFYQ